VQEVFTGWMPKQWYQSIESKYTITTTPAKHFTGLAS